MQFDVQHMEKVSAFRFYADAGDVGVVAYIDGPEEASLAIYEYETALASVGKTDEAVRSSPEAVSARNRFGLVVMREILREVRAALPHIKTWNIDPVTRRNQNRRRRAWLA